MARDLDARKLDVAKDDKEEPVDLRAFVTAGDPKAAPGEDPMFDLDALAKGIKNMREKMGEATDDKVEDSHDGGLDDLDDEQ